MDQNNLDRMKYGVEVRGRMIGEGIPKICVPMVGKDLDQLQREALELSGAGADLAEWRLDYFSFWPDEAQVRIALAEIRNCLGNLPLLVTFRTKGEGGNSEILPEQYKKVYEIVLESGEADLLDLEFCFDPITVSELLILAKRVGVKTVVSNHNFDATPSKEEMVERIFRMRQWGADIVKIAVMPQSLEDVIGLLSATVEAKQKLDCPIITMSMGGKGVISRLSGQIFGSAVTFGRVGGASAPGQIPLDELRQVLTIIDSTQSDTP